MKSKLIGAMVVIFGLAELLFQAILLKGLLYELPKIYQDINVELPTAAKIFPYVSGLVITLMLGVIYIGLRLLFIKNSGKKLYKLGLLSLALTLLLIFVLTGFSVLTVVMPIYQVTAAL